MLHVDQLLSSEHFGSGQLAILAAFVALIIGLVFLGCIWITVYRTTSRLIRENERAVIGFGSGFDARLQNYLRAVELLVGLVAAGIGWFAVATLQRNLVLPWYFTASLVLLALSAASALTFIGFLIRSYEAFTTGVPYRPARFAFIVALGYTTLFCFSVGLILLVFGLILVAR